MDAGNGESTQDLELLSDQQLVTHLNLQPLSQLIDLHVLYFPPNLLYMSSDNKRKILSLAQQMDVLKRLDSGQFAA